MIIMLRGSLNLRRSVFLQLDNVWVEKEIVWNGVPAEHVHICFIWAFLKQTKMQQYCYLPMQVKLGIHAG